MDGDIDVMLKILVVSQEVDASLMLVLFVQFARDLETHWSSTILMNYSIGACIELKIFLVLVVGMIVPMII